MSVKYYIFVIAVIKKDSYRNMKKLIGAFLLVLGLGFVACENETKNGDPSIIAMVNNEEYTIKTNASGMKFETWRPNYNELKVANENVFFMKAETDTTMFALRVPYTLFENQPVRSFEFGDVVQATEDNKNVAFAQYIVYDKKSKTQLAVYRTAASISNSGIFSYADDKKQVPGTVTAEFFANMQKEKPEGYDKLTTKQKEYYEKLQPMKSFQDGVIYIMPVSAGK
ncbi:hypothetical protein SAMN04488018_10229 [Myroides marinus]|uniref:Uncharacterized protein n=2 Tax=Myroides marinus TaxID=703342 RepID=A0A1H6RP13_9FLAO|nr:hypothetical protein SAMN04488018_10229 [Myroides marinus]